MRMERIGPRSPRECQFPRGSRELGQGGRRRPDDSERKAHPPRDPDRKNGRRPGEETQIGGQKEKGRDHQARDRDLLVRQRQDPPENHQKVEETGRPAEHEGPPAGRAPPPDGPKEQHRGDQDERGPGRRREGEAREKAGEQGERRSRVLTELSHLG